MTNLCHLVVQRSLDHEERPSFQDEHLQLLGWTPMISLVEYPCEEAGVRWHRIDQVVAANQISIISSYQCQQHVVSSLENHVRQMSPMTQESIVNHLWFIMWMQLIMQVRGSTVRHKNNSFWILESGVWTNRKIDDANGVSNRCLNLEPRNCGTNSESWLKDSRIYAKWCTIHTVVYSMLSTLSTISESGRSMPRSINIY
jgi:hypothetical protein